MSLLYLLALQIASSPTISFDHDTKEVSVEGLPAISADGWVAYTEAWSDYSDAGSETLVVERLDGSKRKTVLLWETPTGGEIEVAEAKRRRSAVIKANRLLAARKLIRLTAADDQSRIAVDYQSATGVVTIKQGKHQRRRTLPRESISKFCCDGLSTTGTCSVTADWVRAWVSAEQKIALVSYAYGMGLADACETQGGWVIIKLL